MLEENVAMECSASASEPTTYYIILIMGVLFVILYLLAAYNSKRFGMKYILSECNNFVFIIASLQSINFASQLFGS